MISTVFSTVLSTTCTCATGKTCSTGSCVAQLAPGRLRVLHKFCLLDLVPRAAWISKISTFSHELHLMTNTRRGPPRSSSRWSTVLLHQGGRQLRESFAKLSHVRSDSTLATVTGLPLFRCLHTMVAETASSHAEPFARRPIPAQKHRPGRVQASSKQRRAHTKGESSDLPLVPMQLHVSSSVHIRRCKLCLRKNATDSHIVLPRSSFRTAVLPWYSHHVDLPSPSSVSTNFSLTESLDH